MLRLVRSWMVSWELTEEECLAGDLTPELVPLARRVRP